MSFHVGQRVVFVDDRNFVDDYRADSLPRKGDVCTVRGFSRSAMGQWLLIEEHRSRFTFPSTGEEVGYRISRFRPVRETSIECFRIHLAPIKQREEA